MKRILFLATTTGYQTRMFGEAAERLGVKLVFATDRCDQLDDPWWDGAIAVRFHQEATTVDAVVRAAEKSQIAGILAVGDRPTVAAAYAARLLGLAGNPPEAAMAARDKRLTRERLRAAGLPVPEFLVVRRSVDPRAIAPKLRWPAVVKPAALSGSRGVMRADNPAQFIAAFDRLRRLLESTDVAVLQDPAADDVIIESFIEGREYALEGVLQRGQLHPLTIFDKPDPLDGPLFEETIYVTPSRAPAAVQDAIRDTVAAAVVALGLQHGPVHAECRVNDRGVFVLEVAARPIGGLCARALQFTGPSGESAGLEELLLRHALGEPVERWRRERGASGVMMIPIPAGGIFRRVEGAERAQHVHHVCDVRITAKADQPLVPLPEGASYLGFIFAKADSPDLVEQALRDAHAQLTFVIDRALPMAERRVADR
jgi:biotin carboxylase